MSESNKNPLSPVNVNVDLDATKLVDNTVTKAGGAVTDTFVDVWQLTTRWVQTLNEKSKIKQENNLKLYKESLENKIDKILPENLQEPSMAIMGPALKASEFFYEEDYYRDLFSSLLAKSFDSKYNDTIHPSFTETIKQLSKDDAEFIFNLRHRLHDTFVVAKILAYKNREDKKYSGHLSIPESNIILPEIRLSNFEISTNLIPDRKLSRVVENLSRLGIIEIEFGLSIDKEHLYDRFKRFNTYQNLKNRFTESNLEISKGIFTLTQYGINFISICVDN